MYEPARMTQEQEHHFRQNKTKQTQWSSTAHFLSIIILVRKGEKI